MLSLRSLLSLQTPLRIAVITTIASLVAAHPTDLIPLHKRQTTSSCNPTEGSDCPADTALAKSTSISLTSSSDQFTTSGGNPSYGSSGASFTISDSGQSPTLTSSWYIMFGTYSITMKAAPGAGIVSSVVLQSDDLDEIDWEFLGAENSEVQLNYFGKGQTDTGGRAATVSVDDSQGTFHTYTLVWTETAMVWSIDGTTVRSVLATDAPDGQYPQTPMRLKIGIWSGGDPSNAAGTIAWAEGPTDYSNGPFTMLVKNVAVEDYSTGSSYTYGNSSGLWESIESDGGSVNGNAPTNIDTAGPTVTSSSSGSDIEPYGGQACATCTTPGIGTWVASSTATCTYTAAATSYLQLPSGYSIDSCTGKVITPSAANDVVVPLRAVVVVAMVHTFFSVK